MRRSRTAVSLLARFTARVRRWRRVLGERVVGAALGMLLVRMVEGPPLDQEPWS